MTVSILDAILDMLGCIVCNGVTLVKVARLYVSCAGADVALIRIELFSVIVL